MNREKTMLKNFVVAGLLGFVAVFIFSLVGVHARLNGIDTMGNAPAAVGRSLGLAALFFVSVIMMTSAGSTLDSTFTSLAKLPAFSGVVFLIDQFRSVSDLWPNPLMVGLSRTKNLFSKPL